MKFTDAPSCHEHDRRYRPIVWELRAGDPPDVRRCSYCGSIHPQDLITLATSLITLEIADWKYGWPHKVYVTVGKHLLKFYSQHFVDCADDEACAAVNAVLTRVGLALLKEADSSVSWGVRRTDAN